MARQEVNVEWLATNLNVARRTIDRIIDDAKIKPVATTDGGSRLFHVCDITNALYNKDRLNLQDEKAALTKAQKEKTELQVKQLAGDLVLRDEVVNDAITTSKRIKTLLMGLPGRLCHIFAGKTDAREIEQQLKEELETVMTTFKTSEYINDDLD